MARPGVGGRFPTLTIARPLHKDYLNMAPTGKILRLAAVFACVLILGSCGKGKPFGGNGRTDLFSLPYGSGENQAETGPEGLDIFMREGIFHVSVSGGRKIMRLSSYGDLLALLYDPETNPAPLMLETPSSPENGTGAGSAISESRYAIPENLVSPGTIAADAAQTVYVADRAAKDSKGWVVRRFGKRGADLGDLGQEGEGGSPFPFIRRLFVLDDGSLVVFSISKDDNLVHRFDREGLLLSALKIGRSMLPVPAVLKGLDQPENGSRMFANLEDIAVLGADEYSLVLKTDYYRETFDPQSGAVSETELPGSWAHIVDGSTGRMLGSFALPGGDSGDKGFQLIGTAEKRIYFLEDENAPPAPGGEKGPKAVGLLALDGKGKTRAKARLELPGDSGEIVSMKVSGQGYVYALLKGAEGLRAVWWLIK